MSDTLDTIAPRPRRYPAPTVPPPSDDDIEEWLMDTIAEATDGCEVEPDGTCPHGHPSWLLVYGLI